MDIFNIASALFGSSRIEDSGGLSNTVDSVSAVGATASVDGSVGITMDADVTPADDIDGEDTDQTIIDVPTSPAVNVEDDLILGLTGDGPLKVPVVLANPGSGDRQQAQINSAVGLAEAAEAVASATGQHFWPDTDGVHVTEVTQEDWNDSTSTNYHSGANVLLNALGQLFRDGLNNLLALMGGTNPGVAIYDGAGNDAENVVASFDGDGMTVFNNGLKLMKVGNLGNVYGIASYINDVLTGYIHSISGSINVHGVDATSVTGGSSFQSGLGEVNASAGSVRETLWLSGDTEQAPSFERSVSSSGFTERTKTSANTWSTPSGTVLWSSTGNHMISTHTAHLSRDISTCQSGVLLHWQPYTSGTTQTWGHVFTFIQKAQNNGTGCMVILATSKFAVVGTKYVYVYDNRIVGNDDNNKSGTANGITYNNAYWVMTQVIAV